MPYRILHLLGSAQPEGAGIARIAATLARGLDPARYALEAWFLREDGPLVAELHARGVAARHFPWAKGKLDPLGAWRFWRTLRQQPFAVVHQHGGGRTSCMLAHMAGAKVVLQLHGSTVESVGRSVSFDARGADKVVAVCESAAKMVASGTAEVIYTGVPIPAPRPSDVPFGPPIVGTACRLSSIKRVSELIRAIASVRERVPDVRLEIAGSGPERSNLENLVSDLGLTASVRFLGWRDDLAAVMSRWSVFALFSSDEGLPVALLEAMAAGLPSVASSVGGVPEVVENGRTGWLVPPEDGNALASRLTELLLDPALRRAMGVAAHARAAEQFSPERMTAKFAALYDELTSR